MQFAGGKPVIHKEPFFQSYRQENRNGNTNTVHEDGGGVGKENAETKPKIFLAYPVFTAYKRRLCSITQTAFR